MVVDRGRTATELKVPLDREPDDGEPDASAMSRPSARARSRMVPR